VPGASHVSTVLEVRSHDEPGLLHRIGVAVASAGAGVRAAVVGTLGAEAVDVLYLTGLDGRPLPGDEARAVRDQVAAAVAGGDA
jgi:[protein-PII] uridylyltransferase